MHIQSVHPVRTHARPPKARPMKTPLSNGNAAPLRCGCWMARGADHLYREICDAFDPNPMAVLEFGGKRYELCYTCEHPEACHLPPEQR